MRVDTVCIYRKQKSGQPTDEKTESLTAAPVEEADPEAAKKKADSLWADFMKDVGNVGRPPAKSTPSTVVKRSNNNNVHLYLLFYHN